VDTLYQSHQRLKQYMGDDGDSGEEEVDSGEGKKRRARIAAVWRLSSCKPSALQLKSKLDSSTPVDVSTKSGVRSLLTRSIAERRSRSKSGLHFLLNVLQCPVIPLLLAPRLVSLRSGESFGLHRRVIT
jgi:hypothetical protein